MFGAEPPSSRQGPGDPGKDTTGSELCSAMGAHIHPLAELCGVFSSWEEHHAQETQFSPTFCGRRQWEHWETLFVASLRAKQLQEHNPLLDTRDLSWGAGVSSAPTLGRALPTLDTRRSSPGVDVFAFILLPSRERGRMEKTRLSPPRGWRTWREKQRLQELMATTPARGRAGSSSDRADTSRGGAAGGTTTTGTVGFAPSLSTNQLSTCLG